MDKLVEAIASKTNFNLTDSKKFLNAFISTVAEEFEEGKVTLLNFVTSSTANREEKSFSTSKTAAKITIESEDGSSYNLQKSVVVIIREPEEKKSIIERLGIHSTGEGGDEVHGIEKEELGIHGTGKGGGEVHRIESENGSEEKGDEFHGTENEGLVINDSGGGMEVGD